MKCRCPLIRERWSRCPRTNSALSPRRETFYISRRGALAQLGERLVCNQEVAGSIPVRSIPPFALSFLGVFELAARHHGLLTALAVLVNFDRVLAAMRQLSGKSGLHLNATSTRHVELRKARYWRYR